LTALLQERIKIDSLRKHLYRGRDAIRDKIESMIIGLHDT